MGLFFIFLVHPTVGWTRTELKEGARIWLALGADDAVKVCRLTARRQLRPQVGEPGRQQAPAVVRPWRNRLRFLKGGVGLFELSLLAGVGASIAWARRGRHALLFVLLRCERGPPPLSPHRRVMN